MLRDHCDDSGKKAKPRENLQAVTWRKKPQQVRIRSDSNAEKSTAE